MTSLSANVEIPKRKTQITNKPFNKQKIFWQCLSYSFLKIENFENFFSSKSSKHLQKHKTRQQIIL